MNNQRQLNKKKLALTKRILNSAYGKRNYEALRNRDDYLNAIISAEKMETLEAIEKNMNSLIMYKEEE